MPILFKNLDATSGSFTYAGRKHEVLLSRLAHLDSGLLSFKISPKQYFAKIEDVRLNEPNFVNTYVSIASYWVFMSKPKKAKDAALLALSVAHRLIPPEFDGFIVGNHPTNIAYLRAMNIVLEGYMELHHYKNAITQITKILAKDRSDREGARFILGSFAMRAGDYELSRAAFEKYVLDDAIYFYELGLCHMVRDEWKLAETALRQGLSINPYVVNELCSACGIQSATIAHSPSKDVSEALDYVQNYGKLWQKRGVYLMFVRKVQALL